jgi:Domain of unknown function (DUF4352)
MSDDLGSKMQSAGERMESFGWTLTKIVISGFVVFVLIVIAIAALSSSSGSGRSISTPLPQPATAEVGPELGIGDHVKLKGENTGERVEATLVAYRKSVFAGEYDEPEDGMRFVGVTLRIRNIGSVSYSDSPSNGAVILTPRGEQGKTATIATGECSENFAESVRIAPGQSQEGCIAFEIPEGVTAAKLQWTPSSGFSNETAEWTIVKPPAAGEAPHLEVGTGTGSGAKSCGKELSSDENTSCPFAHEVLKAFVAEYVVLSVPPASISAYSPVTHKTYGLKCFISNGEEVECNSGTATVVFPLASAKGYKTEEETK